MQATPRQLVAPPASVQDLLLLGTLRVAQDGLTIIDNNNNVVARPNPGYVANAGASPLTLLAASMTGPSDLIVNLTVALAGAGSVVTDTAANILAVTPGGQIVGQTYKLRLINSSTGAFAWTLTGGTGVTIVGTATIAQNTWRDFIVTVTGATTVSIQNAGTGTFS